MTRVLHVYGRRAHFQTARGVAQLRSGLGAGFNVRSATLGDGGDFGSVPVAAYRLRAFRGETDVVHAWGARALAAVALAGFARIVFSPTRFPTRSAVGWLRAVMNYRDVRVVCPTATMGRVLIERGVAAERVGVVRPGVDFGRVRGRRDPALRAALGLAEGQAVMLAVGESTREAAHHLVVWAGTILNVLDHKTRVLLWGRGPLAASAARLGTKMGHPDLVTLAERRLGRPMEFEELLPAADVVVVSATGPVSMLPVVIAMAANVPIVAAVTPTVAELLEDRHTALMTPPAEAKALANRVRAFRDDPQLRRTVADRARSEAYEFLAQTRFLAEWRATYRGEA